MDIVGDDPQTPVIAQSLGDELDRAADPKKYRRIRADIGSDALGNLSLGTAIELGAGVSEMLLPSTGTSTPP